MKTVLKTWAFCLCLTALAACGSSKHAVSDKSIAAEDAFNHTELMTQMETQLMNAEFVTAKMKFNLRHNNQNISVGGYLKMKKDDVIQLSLVAFGFVEAARIELTKDEVLVIDRINKRYVRSPYSKLSFLNEAELNFYSLQSLFRNEVFVPGKRSVMGNESLLDGRKVSDESAVYSYQNKKLKFKFLVNLASALVQQVQVGSSKAHEDPTFNWVYSNFQDFKGRRFPVRHKIVLAGDKGFEADIVLSNLANDSKWETRTPVKDSYTRLDAETMLIRLLQLN